MTFIASAFSVLVRAAAFLLAAGVAVLALAAQGGRFSNRLDALAHGAPFLLGAALVALVVWALFDRRTKATAALGVLGALSAFLLMAPELLARAGQTQVPANSRTLKLIQFNLWGRNADPEAGARWILEEDPDILVFEEGFERSGGTARALAGRYPYVTTCADPQPCSTMILSKRPPIAEGGLGTPGMATWLSGAWATYPGNGKPFTVIGVHLTWPWPAGPQQIQMKRLNNVVQGFPKESLIVAGDFNSTPWSFSLRRQDAMFGLERRTRALASWPARDHSAERKPLPFPVLPIDQVYAGSDWKTVEVRRGPKLGSDHYPVVVRLARD